MIKDIRSRFFIFLSIIFAIGATFLPHSVEAAGWVIQPSGTTATLYAISFINSTTGWAVGGGGTILKTTDSGATWTAESSGTTTILRDTFFVTSFVGFAVGDGGTILKTTNGGATWTALSSGTSVALTGVQFYGETIGLVVGDSGTILKTINGGTTWTLEPSGTTVTLQKVYLSGSNGWAVGSGGVILHTTDLGTSWSAQTSGTSAILNGVTFINSTTGWVTGASGTILKTTNGGATWTAQSSNTPGTLWGVSFIDSMNGWVVGGAQVLSTTDGGATWTATSLNTGRAALDIQFVNTSSVGYLVGGGGLFAVYDGIPPDTTITANPVASTTDTSASFSFTATETGSTFECALDSAAFTSCASPKSYSGLAVGSHTFQVRATDSVGNTDPTPASFSWTITSAAPPADTTAPSTPSGAQRTTSDSDTTPTFTWNPSTDNVGVTAYEVYVTNPSTGAIVIPVTNVGNVLTWTVPDSSVLSPGSYSFAVRAKDAAGNASGFFGISFTITSTSGSDTIPPSAPTNLIRTSADTSQNPSFSWSASMDNVGVTSYEYQLDGGTFVNIGNTLSATLPTTSVGSHTFGVHARDAAGNASGVTSLSFTITSVGSGGDTTPPSTPTGFMRTSSDSDTTPTFTWNPSTDNVAVTAYHFQIDGGIFIGLGDTTTYTTPELSIGTHAVGVRAGDGAGNTSPVASLTFTITAAGGGGSSQPLPLSGGVSYGDLIKLPNDGDPNTYADTAVFYVGANGKRYVFPNDKVYFTWYTDFSKIKIVDSKTLALIPLGGNVTYRPGVRMVKLQTAPDVYVVSRGGVLQKVPSELVAAELYGAAWNKQIDDVPDAFWVNYTTGASLASSADYSPSAAMASATSISMDKGL